MRPVEEKIFHKEDKVSLPKDLPKGRKCIEAKVYSDDWRHVAGNRVDYKLIDDKIPYGPDPHLFPVDPFPGPFRTFIDFVLLVGRTQAKVTWKGESSYDQLEDCMNEDGVSAYERVLVLNVRRP